MPDLGIDVLFKGTNMLRLLQGLWVAMKISIVSILISMPSVSYTHLTLPTIA